jgi:hypothetical protein
MKNKLVFSTACLFSVSVAIGACATDRGEPRVQARDRPSQPEMGPANCFWNADRY